MILFSYGIGATSQMVCREVNSVHQLARESPNPPPSYRSLSVVLVDRTLDLVGPTAHSDFTLDRLCTILRTIDFTKTKNNPNENTTTTDKDNTNNNNNNNNSTTIKTNSNDTKDDTIIDDDTDTSTDFKPTFPRASINVSLFIYLFFSLVNDVE